MTVTHDPWHDAPRVFVTPEAYLEHYPGIASNWVHELYGGDYWAWRQAHPRTKLELGAGYRPTRGYEHNDTHPFPHIEHVGDAWMLNFPDNSCSEVLALAFIEHLTYDHALDTFRDVHRMLKPGGVFLFDVPDYPTWCQYYLDALAGYDTPLPLEHIRKTLFGWQRWPGDEHLWGWDQTQLYTALLDVGFRVECGLGPFLERGLYRRRFHNPDDAHLYVCATK